jgi:hypothetical protein
MQNQKLAVERDIYTSRREREYKNRPPEHRHIAVNQSTTAMVWSLFLFAVKYIYIYIYHYCEFL